MSCDDIAPTVKRQLDAFRENWGQVNSPTRGLKNLTPYDVPIIASTVEKRGAVAPRRASARSRPGHLYKPAARRHEILGIDATTRYGLHVPVHRAVRSSQSELAELEPVQHARWRSGTSRLPPDADRVNPGPPPRCRRGAHPAKALPTGSTSSASPTTCITSSRQVHAEFSSTRTPHVIRVITGRTVLVALVEHPVSGCSSPEMAERGVRGQRARLGLRRVSIAPGVFERRRARACRARFAGANVTTPHKAATGWRKPTSRR